MRRWTPALAGVILALLALPAMATADTGQGTSTGSDRGHAARADWSAGPVARGTGYTRAEGSRRVREVQRRLRSLGYHPGPVDGLYGPRTERAARRFQEARRLRADAVVGPRTLAGAAHPRRRPSPGRDHAGRTGAAADRGSRARSEERRAGHGAAAIAVPARHGPGDPRRARPRGRRRELRQDATPRPRRDAGVAPATARTQVGGGTGMRDVRVVIADPDALARRTVREALAAAHGVAAVAGAGCGREAVELVRYHRPDVLITEATHPDVEADELCRRVAVEAPDTAVVVLCAVEDPELAVRCLRAGAVGYLTKDTEPERLPDVVRGVAEGEAAISRRLTLRLIESLRDVPDTGWRPVRSRLTSREWEVMDLLGEGASTDAIAEHLVLSPATVYSHVKNVHAKLGVHSRHDAVAAAMVLRREEATCAA